MKFTFKYDSLMNVRRHEQKKQQQRLAELMNRRRQLREKLGRLRRNVSAPMDESERRQTVQGVRRSFQHHMSLLKQVWNLEQDLLKLEQEIENQRNRLLEASRKKSMLEKLEAREKMNFVKNLQHREQLRQNEIATQMYNRRA